MVTIVLVLLIFVGDYQPVRYNSTAFYNDATTTQKYCSQLNNMNTDLVRGDALVCFGSHILLFDYYDPSGNGIWSLEQYAPPGANRYYNSLNALTSEGYIPIRRQWVDDSTPLFNFSVTSPHNINIQPGGSATVVVTINYLAGPNDEEVTVFLNNLPSGIVPTYSATIGIPKPGSPFQSSFSLQAFSSAIPGSYNLNIIATGGGKTDQSKYFTINVSSMSLLPLQHPGFYTYLQKDSKLYKICEVF